MRATEGVHPRHGVVPIMSQKGHGVEHSLEGGRTGPGRVCVMVEYLGVLST